MRHWTTAAAGAGSNPGVKVLALPRLTRLNLGTSCGCGVAFIVKFQPGGLADISRGPSVAKTPGSGLFEFRHPARMPAFCDPAGVEGRSDTALQRGCRFPHSEYAKLPVVGVN
jgi:hypothetical protein